MRAKKKILVVDDSGFFRNTLKGILQEQGYEVGSAENGLEAVAQFKELRPELVILDMIMPGMNGLETMKVLQSVDPNVRVIMVSMMSTPSSVNDCLKAGARDYVVKPFEKNKVVDVIRRAFAQ